MLVNQGNRPLSQAPQAANEQTDQDLNNPPIVYNDYELHKQNGASSLCMTEPTHPDRLMAPVQFNFQPQTNEQTLRGVIHYKTNQLASQEFMY